jgi:hypothetical protein
MNVLVQSACDVAMGRALSNPESRVFRIVGAKKDLNSKENGAHWYRMVLRNGKWEYVATERLPTGSFLASDRRATVYGDAYHGEITITHDRGSDVDLEANLLVEAGEHDGLDLTKSRLIACDVTKTRAGLEITLLDGSILKTTNPRKK